MNTYDDAGCGVVPALPVDVVLSLPEVEMQPFACFILNVVIEPVQSPSVDISDDEFAAVCIALGKNTIGSLNPPVKSVIVPETLADDLHIL